MSIAAVVLMRERRLVERLREAGATAPESARPLAELRGVDDLAMRRLRERAVIRESTAGSFYLDELSWSSLRSMRRRLVAVVIGVALAVALVGYFGLGR